MKKLYWIGALALTVLTFSCSKGDGSEPASKQDPTPTPKQDPTPTPPAEKKATATVTATLTGITPSEVKILMTNAGLDAQTKTVLQEKELSIDGKASFDVKNYIDKEVYFLAQEKSSKEYLGEAKATIKEGDNAIALTAKKVEVGVKITVKIDGKVAPNTEVYAVSPLEKSTLDTFKNVGYSQSIAKSTFSTKATTDKDGVASFGKLLTTGTFKFIVFEPSKYYEIEVQVDNKSLKTGEISITSIKPITITVKNNGVAVADKVVYFTKAKNILLAQHNTTEKANAYLQLSGTVSVLKLMVARTGSLALEKATTNANGVITVEGLEEGVAYLFFTEVGEAYRGVLVTPEAAKENSGTIDIYVVTTPPSSQTPPTTTPPSTNPPANNPPTNTNPQTPPTTNPPATNNPTTPQEQPVSFVVSVRDDAGNPIVGATVLVGGVTHMTGEDGITTGKYNGETNSTYDLRVTVCGEDKYGTITTKGTNITRFNHHGVYKAQKSTLVLNNTSSNPYTVTIGSKSYVVQGKSKMNVEIYHNTVQKVSWKQNSGYLFSATTGDENVSTKCNNKTATVSFP